MQQGVVFQAFVSIGLLIPSALGAQSFAGSGAGPIPDGGPDGPADWGAPLSITFAVSGLTGSVADLSLSMTLQHGYAGDIECLLVPPPQSGAQPFVIFSRLGQPGDVGDPGGSPAKFSADRDGNVPGTYVFNDRATGNLWLTAGFNPATGTADFTDVFNIASGSYRTSAAGPWDSAGNPNGGNHQAGQPTSFAADSGFVGLTPAQANGVWTLQFRDGFQFDSGTVVAADLTIETVPEPAVLVLVSFGLFWLGLRAARTRRTSEVERRQLTS